MIIFQFFFIYFKNECSDIHARASLIPVHLEFQSDGTLLSSLSERKRGQRLLGRIHPSVSAFVRPHDWWFFTHDGLHLVI